jgi:hypothetical protein
MRLPYERDNHGCRLKALCYRRRLSSKSSNIPDEVGSYRIVAFIVMVDSGVSISIMLHYPSSDRTRYGVVGRMLTGMSRRVGECPPMVSRYRCRYRRAKDLLCWVGCFQFQDL